MTRGRTRRRLGCAVAAVLLAVPLRAQTPDAPARPAAPDTLAADTLGTTARGAVRADSVAADSSSYAARVLRRSLLVPGWGQLSLGQPVRAAVAASAVAGAVGYLVVRQRQYTRYRRAALVAGCAEAPDREVCADIAYAVPAWENLGRPDFAAVAPVRNTARGRRDVAGLVVGLVYAVQALDAYVGAELAEFDVSEDLSVRLVPAADGAALAARWRW